MTLKFVDNVEIRDARLRDDGYLVVDARVARTGVQDYLGSEVGRADLAQVSVYRSEDEVFSDEAMASFAHRPVTDDHPTERVTADNWKQFAIGQTADEIARDKKFLRVPLMVADAAVIDKIQYGKRELSAGYSCELKFEPGVTEDGQKYDAIQTNIRANHVAIVDRGRAGKECRIGDSATHNWGAAPITTVDKDINMPQLRTVVVDGLTVETTDQGAQAIDKLLKTISDADNRLVALSADHDKAVAALDEQIAKRDAQIDDLNSKVLDQDAIDRLVADRAALENTVSKIAKDINPKGMSDADLRRATVVAKFGDSAIDGKSDAYVEARFDILAEDASKTTDEFRAARKSAGPVHNNNDVMVARDQAFAELQHFDQYGSEMGA